MNPGDLVQLFSRVDTYVWCWDEDDNTYYFPNGTSVVIIRHGEDLQNDDPNAIDQVLCDGKAVWVHRNQLAVFNEAR